METLLPGITAERLATSRLTAGLLSVAGRGGPAVLFVHGNVSSSLFWQPTMLALPETYRPLAIDLLGFGDTDPVPVDATRGAIPGWPGEQAWPPQPMLAQTRAVLDGYAAAGGRYREVAIEDSGHGPHLDQPERFLAELCSQLA